MAKKKSSRDRMTIGEWFADKRDAILDWFDDVRDWWDDLAEAKRNTLVAVIALVVALVIILVAYGVTTGFSGFASLVNNEEETQSQEEVYVAAGADDPIAQTQEISATDANDLGYDVNRAQQDEEKIRAFCNVAFNFANQDDYARARIYLADNYKGFEDWQFASEFMPATYVGDEYSVMFMQVEAYVTAVEGDVYSYTCDVVVRTKSPNGGQATGKILMDVTTTATGDIRDVKAYATTAIS